MVDDPLKAASKSCMMGSGEECATGGVNLHWVMWCADSWATPEPRRMLMKRSLEEGKDQCG